MVSGHSSGAFFEKSVGCNNVSASPEGEGKRLQKSLMKYDVGSDIFRSAFLLFASPHLTGASYTTVRFGLVVGAKRKMGLHARLETRVFLPQWPCGGVNGEEGVCYELAHPSIGWLTKNTSLSRRAGWWWRRWSDAKGGSGLGMAFLVCEWACWSSFCTASPREGGRYMTLCYIRFYFGIPRFTHYMSALHNTSKGVLKPG